MGRGSQRMMRVRRPIDDRIAQQKKVLADRRARRKTRKKQEAMR
jgi:hypothetical protein